MKIDEISTSKTIIKHSKSVIDDKLNVPDDCPMPNKCSVIVVSGAMGSGKSAFLSSMFCSKGNGRIYNNTFEHIHYVTPLETFESEENHPFKDHNKSRLHHELTTGILNQIAEDAIEIKHEKGNTALIIDDFSENLKDKKIENALRRLIHKHRHMKLLICISLLTLKSLPRSLRTLIDCYVIFKPKSLIEIQVFAEEVFSLSKPDLKSLFDYVFDKQYNFLLYDQRLNLYHKNFNLLRLNEE